MLKGDIITPRGWYLHALRHIHSPIIYRGDRHKPIIWEASLQYVDGGLLTTRTGDTAQDAVVNVIGAIPKIEE